jgi:hypothetical protein
VTRPRDEAAAIGRRFAEMAEQVFTRLPLYRRLAEGAAADLDVAARLLLAPSEQRVPNLLLAAVHDVLLAGEPDALADWYPSVPSASGAARIARPVGHGADDPWPHFRALALGHEGVAERLRTRATQTNEVGRSLALVPALFDAARRAASSPPGGIRPLGIVEIGASAGLNLRLDAYGYRYEGPAVAGGSRIHESIGSGSRLVLEGALRGPLVPPLPVGGLPIATAVGIDERPLSVGHADDARWLVACHWPEERERLEQLRAAIALAQEAPPVVERGDAVDDLAQHLLAVPSHALPVVVSTWVLTYLSVARQLELLAVLDEVATARDLALVFAEQPERVPGMPVPPRPDGQPDGRATALVRVSWHGRRREAVRLADQHPHGRWLEWLQP